MGAYAIPLAVLGVGVVGMWLLGPKSKSTTSPPAGIPDMNQSLRGSAVQVTFGASRVTAQVVWTNRFNAVRQKSSGKGAAKGGGSGGFGGAKGGGAAGQMYEYYWDMIFNFGIVDQPSVARRMWIGGDDVDAPSLSSITGGLSDTLRTNWPIVTSIPDQDVATMKFQEAFYAPGFPTADPDLDIWPYFESVAAGCAFPMTNWIGFEQLDLGQAPTVPQISAELTPLTAGGGSGGDPSAYEDLS